MDIIQILILLIVIGFILFAVNSWLPIDAKIKMIINAVVVLVVVVWLLSLFFPGLRGIRVGMLDVP